MNKQRIGNLVRAWPLIAAAAVLTAVLPVFSGLKGEAAEGQKAGRLYAPSMADCGGFSVQAAAEILGLPASQLASKTDELYAGAWTCSFTSAIAAKSVAFTVTVAKSVADATEDMERLRANLSTAGETAPFKDKLPKGAYSDIMGLGDDAVWTDVNGSLSVRKGNVTVLVMSPPDKMTQIKVAERLLSKLK